MARIQARVVLTEAAQAVLDQVRSRRGGELALVIGNGCCDSTAPYLFADYLPGPNEHQVGRIDGVPVLLDEAVARSFQGTEIVIDAREGNEPDSFSCEAEIGRRFVLERLPRL